MNAFGDGQQSRTNIIFISTGIESINIYINIYVVRISFSSSRHFRLLWTEISPCVKNKKYVQRQSDEREYIAEWQFT